jgi:hypothetical protein
VKMGGYFRGIKCNFPIKEKRKYLIEFKSIFINFSSKILTFKFHLFLSILFLVQNNFLRKLLMF